MRVLLLILALYMLISHVESYAGSISSSFGGLGGPYRWSGYGSGYGGFAYKFNGIKTFSQNSNIYNLGSVNQICKIDYLSLHSYPYLRG